MCDVCVICVVFLCVYVWWGTCVWNRCVCACAMCVSPCGLGAQWIGFVYASYTNAILGSGNVPEITATNTFRPPVCKESNGQNTLSALPVGTTFKMTLVESCTEQGLLIPGFLTRNQTTPPRFHIPHAPSIFLIGFT